MAASNNLYLEALAFFIIHHISLMITSRKAFKEKTAFLKLYDGNIKGVSNSFSGVGNKYVPIFTRTRIFLKFKE